MSNIITAKEIFDGMNQSSGTKLQVGTHVGVDLTSVEVTDTYIDFNVKKDDLIHNKRIYFPDGDAKPRENESQEAANKRDRNQRLSHIVKFLHIYCGQQAVDTLAAPSVKEFAKKAATLINAKKNTKKINIYLIYDSDGKYSTFPFFARYVEEHLVGKEPTIGPSDWEKEHRMTPSNSESLSVDGDDNVQLNIM